MAVDLESYTSPQVELFKELDRAAHAKDLSLLAKPLHKDFHHVIHPRSLGKLPINRDEWLSTMAETWSAPMQFERASYTGCHSILTQAKCSHRLSIPSWKLQGRLFFVSVSQFVQASYKLKGMFEDRTDESIWIVGFASDEDGSLKIKQTEQFADTSNYLDVFQAVKASK
ncbi:hypothetical protein JVT61DRAFT_2743 [Boletus reticuloceps]|uniref:Uncharacterized protein n=1 Tax=Boletus reticuloceps TaxID=495285 RepID=A0A8I3A8I7_9AGAM|nr:hypothetical protein JVT61DRAFT_2743 [Boletus reticuloceps]